MRLDPPYGWLLTLGSGGILVELLGDTATLLLPASDAGILDVVLVQGWRGKNTFTASRPDFFLARIFIQNMKIMNYFSKVPFRSIQMLCLQ